MRKARPPPLVPVASSHRRLGDVLLDLVGRDAIACEQVERAGVLQRLPQRRSAWRGPGFSRSATRGEGGEARRRRAPRRPRVATPYDGGTLLHGFVRALQDYRRIPTYFARL
jgi:hypothetical protein